MFTGRLLIPISTCIISVTITLHKRRSVMGTLVNRAVQIAGKEHLDEELGLLRRGFAHNGYSPRDIEAVIIQQTRGNWSLREEEEEIRGIAVLPFSGPVTNQISRLLGRHNIKTVSHPVLKVGKCLRSVKDPLGLCVPGGFKISCSSCVYQLKKISDSLLET